MSLKKMDNEFCGLDTATVDTLGYQLLFTLDTVDDVPYVQSSLYTRVMKLYIHIYPRIDGNTPGSDAYDSHALTITSRMDYLCDVIWQEPEQEWTGTSSLGVVVIKMRGHKKFGWPSIENPVLSPADDPFTKRTLYGLLYCGGTSTGPMRLTSTGTYTLAAPSHARTQLATTYNKTLNRVTPPQNVGTYTLSYTQHIAVVTFTPGFNGVTSYSFHGYKIVNVVEVYQYDRVTKAQISKTKTETVVQDPTPPPQPGQYGGSVYPNYAKFQNRRRYHVTPEEEWFHTSGNPYIEPLGQYGNPDFVVSGYSAFSFSGDITSAGCEVVTLPWGVQGVAGGSTFLTQKDYDWTIPETYQGRPVHQPSVTEFINVRRWVWGNLDVNKPRIKIRVNTPDGTAESTWIGTAKFTDLPGNGLSGAGQAWPDDDKEPDYPNQGAPGRVPNLQIYSTFSDLNNCFPDAGLTPYSEYISLQFTQPNPSPIFDTGDSIFPFQGYSFEVIDDSKAAGWNWKVETAVDSAIEDYEDLFVWKKWLDSDYRLFRWPYHFVVTVGGLTTIQGKDYSWMNGSYTLDIMNVGFATSATQSSGGFTGPRYGKTFFGIGPNSISKITLMFLDRVPFIYFRRNGPVDPLNYSGDAGGSFYGRVDNTNRVGFLKPSTHQLFYYSNYPQIALIQGASMTLVPQS